MSEKTKEEIEQEQELHCIEHTSREAYAQIQPSAPQLREKIFEFIKQRGKHGATCDEAEVHLGMRHQTASARFTELKKSKRIKETCRRPTRTGRPAGVCVVNDG